MAYGDGFLVGVGPGSCLVYTKDGVRWRLLSVASADTWRPETLYSNQFFTSLAQPPAVA